MPERIGVTGNQSAEGNDGAVTSTSRSGPRTAPRPAPKAEATRAAANRVSLRSMRSALIGWPHEVDQLDFDRTVPGAVTETLRPRHDPIAR